MNHDVDSDSFRDVILVTSLVALCLLVIWAAFGFHYETNDDPVMEAIFRGFLFPAASTREIGFAHLFTASGFGWLYASFPRFPWYGAAMYLLSMVAMVNILLAVDGSLGRLRRLWERLAILAVFSGLFLAESVLFLNFTRVAILLAGSSILALNRVTSRPGRPGWLALGGLVLLFGLALLTRPDGALLSLATAGMFVLLAPRRGALRPLVVWLVLLTAMAAASRGYSHWNDREAYFRSVYPFLVSIRDFGWVRSGELSADDSHRLEAVNARLFADREAITVDFLSRVSSADHFTSNKMRRDQISTALAQIASGLGPAGWLLVIGNGGVLLLGLRGSRPAPRPNLQRVAAHAFFWGAVCALAVFMRLPPRVFSPVVALYACASLGALPALDGLIAGTGALRWLVMAGSALAMLCTYALPSGIRQMALTSHNGQRANDQLFHDLGDRLEGSLVLLPRPALNAFSDLDPLRVVPLDPGNRYILLGGWPCLLAAFEREVEPIAGSARLSDLFVALQRPGSFILSNDSYNTFLSEHLSALYGLTLSFSPRSSWMRVGPGSKHRLRLYRFRASYAEVASRDGRR